VSKTYKLLLVLTPQPEGGYTVTCPVLPELVTECDDPADAVPNAEDALRAIIEAYEHEGKPLPPALEERAADAPLWLETLLKVS
jgi:antitoxin HicB